MVMILEVPPPMAATDSNTWGAVAENRLWSSEQLAEFGHADLNDPDETVVALSVPSSNRRTLRWVAVDDPAALAPDEGSGHVHVRSINIALGFRPESSEAGWQKIVP